MNTAVRQLGFWSYFDCATMIYYYHIQSPIICILNIPNSQTLKTKIILEEILFKQTSAHPLLWISNRK